MFRLGFGLTPLSGDSHGYMSPLLKTKQKPFIMSFKTWSKYFPKSPLAFRAEIYKYFCSIFFAENKNKVICFWDFLTFKGEQSKRQIVAFIGGLDITDGRYDSPEFPLFKTLKTLHKGDFYRLVHIYVIVWYWVFKATVIIKMDFSEQIHITNHSSHLIKWSKGQ